METENDIVTEDVKSEEGVEEQVSENTEEQTEVSDALDAIELAARLKRAEAKIERMKIEAKVEKKVDSELQKRTGGLDEVQLNYLDLKGYSEPEDIKIIQQVMEKTGKTVREVLRDEYIQAKLKDNQVAREVKLAMPDMTSKGGGVFSDNEDYYFQKYEQTGSLPKNMPKGMAERLVNRKAQQSDVRRSPFE